MIRDLGPESLEEMVLDQLIKLEISKMWAKNDESNDPFMISACWIFLYDEYLYHGNGD